MLYRLRIGDREIPLIEFVVRKFIEVFDDVVVVVGHEKEKIMEVLGDSVKIIFNPRYKVGMSESVKVGVKAVMKYSDIVAIHPADVAFILKRTLRELLKHALNNYAVRSDFILIPKYKVKGGHPLMVGKELLPHVLGIKEEERGLKGFLSRFRDRITYVNVDDVGVLADVDTMEDMERNLPLALRKDD